MSKHQKNRIDLIEEKLETMTKTKWAKGMRITSGVTWNLFLLFLVVGLTLVVFAGSVGAGYFASLVAKEPLRSKARNAGCNLHLRRNVRTLSRWQYLYR